MLLGFIMLDKVFLGFLGCDLVFLGFHWLLPSSPLIIGFRWVLLRLTNFFLGLLGFYQVLLGV